MHGLIASSCLHIINHFHSSEPWQAAEWRGNMTTWDGPRRSGCPLVLLAQVFPEKTNKPSLHPSLSLPTALSPSLPLPSKLLEGIVYSRGLHLSLSLSTSPRPLSPPPSLKHHLPQTSLYDSLSHAWSSFKPPSTELSKSGT